MHHRAMRLSILLLCFWAGVASAAPAEPTPVAAAVGGPDLLAALGPRAGRVFSATPGGEVVAKAGAAAIPLRDGEEVQLPPKFDGRQLTEWASVTARGKKVLVPRGQLIFEARLRRSVDRKWAVFDAIYACQPGSCDGAGGCLALGCACASVTTTMDRSPRWRGDPTASRWRPASGGCTSSPCPREK